MMNGAKIIGIAVLGFGGWYLYRRMRGEDPFKGKLEHLLSVIDPDTGQRRALEPQSRPRAGADPSAFDRPTHIEGDEASSSGGDGDFFDERAICEATFGRFSTNERSSSELVAACIARFGG
jgi:hypothetical protein